MRFMVLGLLAFSVMAASAQERTWGFDKDTVYEWNAGGDTVRLQNNGMEMLWIDSLFGEEVSGSPWHHVSYFFRGANGEGVNESDPNTKSRLDSIPPGSTLLLYRFSVANILTKLSLSKNSDIDTLRVRLRFKSVIGDEDTLIVMGYCCGTSLQPPRMKLDRRSFSHSPRDVLGRALRQTTGFSVWLNNHAK